MNLRLLLNHKLCYLGTLPDLFLAHHHDEPHDTERNTKSGGEHSRADTYYLLTVTSGQGLLMLAPFQLPPLLNFVFSYWEI